MINRRTMLAAGAALATIDAEAAVKTPKGPGLIMSEGPSGWWDSERCSCPRVLRNADGTWSMWYYGRDPSFDDAFTLPTGRIGHARSNDGITWERVRGPLTMGAVMEASPDKTRFDCGHVGVGGVSRQGEELVMWYFGGDETVTTTPRSTSKGFPMRAGRATSRDGLNWTRTPGPYRGALIDVGKPGDFDAVMVGWPHLLAENDGSYKLYYHTLSATEGFMACVAVSSDGLKWDKFGPVLKRGPEDSFDRNGVGSRHVSKIGGRYVMFYEGNDGKWFGGIGLAESRDGLTFRRVKGPDRGGCVLAAPPRDSDRFDSHGIGTPWLVPDGDRFRLYYVGATSAVAGDMESGESRNIHRIGLAFSDGADLTRWTRNGA